jgi:glycosyltransferase involved in cell wall biosynthesis
LLAHSDRPGLEEALGEWIAYLNGLDHPHEIILVDDALVDRTDELARRHLSVRVLRDPTKRGVGAALRLGLAEAHHPLLVYAPCDRQYQPRDLRLLLDEIDKTHVVTGHRAGRPVPVLLRVTGFIWRGLVRVLFGLPLEPLPAWLGWRDYAVNLLARVVFGLRLHDVQCDFRLVRRSVFRRIPIQSDGPFAHIELLAKANFLTNVMTEVAVVHRPAARAPSGWRDAWRVFAHPYFGPAVLPPEESLEDAPAGADQPSEASPDGVMPELQQPETAPPAPSPPVA